MQTDTRLDDAISDLVERLTKEGPIGMGAAARMYGQCREGRPTHPSTVSRHATAGVRLADGRVIRLESIVIGGRRMTSREAVLRFFRAQQTEAADSPPATPTLRSPTQRRRASEAAAARADALLA